MAYSAVTQPSPEPLRHRGTPSLADAAHSTRVRPNSTSTDPAAWSSQLRVMVTGRSSSLASSVCSGHARDPIDGSSGRPGPVSGAARPPGPAARAWRRAAS